MAFTTAINTSLLTTYLSRKFIPALENELQFAKFLTPCIVPAGGGNIGRFNVFSSPNLDQSTTVTALTEGSPTAGEITTLTTVGTNCTIQEYGEFVAITSLEEMAAVPGTRSELVKRFVYGGARTIDSLVRLQAATTAAGSTMYAVVSAAGASTTAASPTAASAAAIIAAGAQLRDNSAPGLTDVTGHDAGNYAAIVSPVQERQIINEGTAGRITWAQAVTQIAGGMGQEKFVKGRVGPIYGTTVYRTQNKVVTNLTVSSDSAYIIAEGGLGGVSFDDMKAEIVLNDVNSPYKNRNSVAYHALFGTALIDTLRVIRLYTGTTAVL